MASVPDYRTGSPVPSSGRASPANPRLKQKEDDVSNKKDKAVKRWAATVERVLATFDQSVDEWADYISFLGRLLKALQTRPPTADDVPFKLLVAKRLAQCLSPALPSGVHQKALDVYTHIFSFLGSSGLSRDISLYLPGLAPLVSFASLSVKPLILAIYEDYLTALHPTAIRPALKALILSLLPALEEENSDEFERALQILASFRTLSSQTEQGSSASGDNSQDQYFWQCIFLATVTSSTRRPGALAYLVRNLPSLGSQLKESKTSNGQASNRDAADDAATSITQPDPGLLIRAFCAGLLDANILVQRGFLDLLVEKLPLSSPVLQKRTVADDLKRLILAATNVVLRRDMSLNRRLWAWFLGPTAKPDSEQDTKSPSSPNPAALKTPTTADDHSAQIAYFNRNVSLMLVHGLREQLESDSTSPTEKTRSLRVCLALMDRFEIGNSIISQILMPAIASVRAFQSSSASKASKTEVLRSGNAFFDSVESFVIWHEVIKTLEAAYEQMDFTKINLVTFLVSKFNVREEDMQSVHLPLTALFAVHRLNKLLANLTATTDVLVEVISATLRLVNNIIYQIPPRALVAANGANTSATLGNEAASSDFVERLQSFYVNHATVGRRFLVEEEIGAGLLQETYETAALALSRYDILSRSATEGAVTLLDAVSRKVSWYTSHEKLRLLLDELLKKSTDLSQTIDQEKQIPDIALILTLTSLLEVLNTSQTARSHVPEDLLRQVVPELAKWAWTALSPGRPQHHVEASRCLWRLHAVTSGNDLVESTIVKVGASLRPESTTDELRLEHAYRFTIFWQQSQGQSDTSRNRRNQIVKVQNTLTTGKLQLLGRPLFQMLDTLLEIDDDVGVLIGHWLEDLSDLAVVVNVVLAHMDKALRPLVAQPARIDASSHTDIIEDVDLETCIYFVRLLGKVIDHAQPSLERTIQEGTSEESREQLFMRLQFIVDSCIKAQASQHEILLTEPRLALNLRQAILLLLEQTLAFLAPESLVRLKVDVILLDELTKAIENKQPMLQIALTKASSAALNRRFEAQRILHELAIQKEAAEAAQGIRRSSVNDDGSRTALTDQFAVPSQVLTCILNAVSEPDSRPILDCWFDFVKSALQLYGPNIFQVILPLNECFCKVLRSMARDLQDTFSRDIRADLRVNETAIIQVLNALERPLEIAHGTLQEQMAQNTAPKSEQQAASFFGMVSVLAPEGGKVKSSTDNNRLTVLLCFKDALRVCFEIWGIDDSSAPGITDDSTRLASFKYSTLRLRNRTRRIVEHLFQARDLECVETLVALWHDFMMEDDGVGCSKVLALLATVETARPKVTIPALFNAIYSRTHPAALDPDKRSSLTSNVSDVTLTAFCTAYLRSLEDDATDEIWQSCLTFLKDVLTSPLNHRQILVQLLEFAVELASKIDNTNFGEQRKMRRELGDLFIRLMSAITTIRPPGTNPEQQIGKSNRSKAANGWYLQLMQNGSADLVSVLAYIFPRLADTLLERDRIPSVASSISTQILGPLLKSRSFPDNIDHETLDLLKVVGQMAEAAKTYKKDVSDAFNDPKFFSSDAALAPNGWLPVLRQWAIGDKERLPDLFSRLSAPAAAGLMFGVGATSARLEADRKTQLTLRRVATILLAGPTDAFIVNLPELWGKLVELLNANVASSPSSITRAELYMLLRALLLRTSANHLNALWPVINSEIADALSSTMPDNSQEALNVESLLQLCKLIDTLLVLNLDEFQLQEWLFITDTCDAMYRPSHLDPTALADVLAESLDVDPSGLSAAHLSTTNTENGLRKPLLTNDYVRTMPNNQYRDKIFRPFFRQLSIASFEGSYSMNEPDSQACEDDLIEDLFDESTLV